ncbi:MAG TPA: helix-turn-helix domain-containing protein [Thermoanaerobaculia bacterium]|nr:helix-turn-helix domain-containing protein [Thermoanaerobaculia bacterium]
MLSIDDRLSQIIRELIASGIPLDQAVEAFEGKYIVAAMAANRGNVTKTSRVLGVHRNTLHNKLRAQTILNGFAQRTTRKRVSARRVLAHARGNGATQKSKSPK